MINIKTKLLIIVMAVVLFVNSYDLRVFANTDYDHDRLLEYDGYAEAMYESIVEQTTFISGRYTENKDYVNESINQITDYAKGWWNEYKTISELPPKEKIREMINAAGGYALTVGDFIKNLFSDGEKNETLNPPSEFGLDKYFVKKAGSNSARPVAGYCVITSWAPQSCTTNLEVTIYASTVNNTAYIQTFSGRFTISGVTVAKRNDINSRWDTYEAGTSLALLSGLMAEFGHSFTLVASVDKEPVKGDSPDSKFKTINNYIRENSPSIVTPKPTAYLSCPDGTRVNMKINGGTFLDVKGNIMSVDKNGTATIDSQICNLGWEKPKVQYIDETDQIGVSTPDGDIIDAETGETIIGGGDSEFDDEIEDGCGMICALGKLLSGLGTIAKAIAAIPLKILDGLLELVKKIFIPEENFWSTNLDGLKEKFFHDELKEVQNGVESLEGVGGGQFGDVTGSLMGVDNLTIIDSSSINMSLEKIHSWVRGFFYPLLLFFNINQMYRVIRGTSLIGIGGKKEE